MLQPKRVEAYRDVWRQIKANGYDVIPLVFGKNRPFKDWPTVPNDEASIARWTGRSAAVRMYGSGLLVIDIDVRIAAIADAIVAMLERDWPVFMATCLRRHSGTAKLALIGRAVTEHRYLNTRRCLNPKEPDDLKGHRVEIFTTNSKRYVGVHGAHSPGREYGYQGRSILEVPAADLPTFPVADIGAMVDACEAIMLEYGLMPTQPPQSGEHKGVIYDIDDTTRFDVFGGPDQIDYDELVGLYVAQGELRISGSFIDGGTNRTRCRVGDCYLARCVGVFDNESGSWHCPKDADPAGIIEKLGERLTEAGIEMKPAPPKWREIYPNGSPRASLHNARLGIEAGGFVAVHDVFHNKLFLGRPAGGVLPPFCGEVTDHRIAMLRVWVSNTYGRDFTEKHVRDAVTTMAVENPFNPIVEMLADAEANWDRVKRLDRMAVDYFGCPDTRLNTQCVRKTMIAAVARARNPGCKFDTILVLESPEGWNKSSAWAILAGEGNFSDERIIGHASREVVEQLAGIWIHENADLAGMKKAEVETVKAYASRAVDRARPAYGHFLVEQPRHSIEIGTTNSDKYLQSQTGNRRFWPLRMERRIDLAALRAVRLQLWGEAAAAQTAGESLVLDEDLWGAAAIEQEERRVAHPWEAVLASMCVIPSTIGYTAGTGLFVIHRVGLEDRVSSVDIFTKVLNIPGGQMHRGHSMAVAEIMRLLGWENKLVRIDGNPVKGYARPVGSEVGSGI